MIVTFIANDGIHSRRIRAGCGLSNRSCLENVTRDEPSDEIAVILYSRKRVIPYTVFTLYRIYGHAYTFVRMYARVMKIRAENDITFCSCIMRAGIPP